MVCSLLALVISSQAKPVKNEMVMVPGTTITATTKSGKMVITAIDQFTRSYTWEGATRSAELMPRPERWYGNLGAYYPGPGDHWREHRGITRGVLEEGQQHFKTVALAMRWIKEQSYIPHVYQDTGLFVGWGKELDRRQLNVEVVQIFINGKKPKKLSGSSNGAIQVSFKKPTSGKDAFHEAVRAGNVETVKNLLAKGADPNLRNAVNSPMLTVAAARGYRRVVQALLEAGANPNARNEEDEGSTPLLRAEDIEVVRMLLAKGADPNAAYTRGILKGHTSLIGAAMTGDLAKARLLLEAGARAGQASADGTTALHWGVRTLEFAKLLLDKGADVNARDYLGTTPLMRAVPGPSPGNRERQIAMVKFLISKGANVNARTDKVRLEYFRASFVGDKATMQRIERSGRLNQLQEDGDSVLDQTGSEEVRAILKAAGAKG